MSETPGSVAGTGRFPCPWVLYAVSACEDTGKKSTGEGGPCFDVRSPAQKHGSLGNVVAVSLGVELCGVKSARRFRVSPTSDWWWWIHLCVTTQLLVR